MKRGAQISFLAYAKIKIDQNGLFSKKSEFQNSLDIYMQEDISPLILF